jgi:hypothetical protein
MPKVNAQFVCLVLAIVFFIFAAFGFPRSTMLTGEASPFPVSWRDLAFAFVVIAFLV